MADPCFFRIINTTPEAHVLVEQGTVVKSTDLVEIQMLEAAPNDDADICLTPSVGIGHAHFS